MCFFPTPDRVVYYSNLFETKTVYRRTRVIAVSVFETLPVSDFYFFPTIDGSTARDETPEVVVLRGDFVFATAGDDGRHCRLVDYRERSASMRFSGRHDREFVAEDRVVAATAERRRALG